MYTKNKLKFSISLFLIFSSLIYCQGQKNKKSEIVKSFFEDVFINDKPYKELYIVYSAKKSNFAKSENERIELFNKQILQLKSDRKHLINKNVNFNVENYNKSFQPNLRHFPKKARKHIFVVSVNDNTECYVWMKKAKILAFHYVMKGKEGPTYFIY